MGAVQDTVFYSRKVSDGQYMVDVYEINSDCCVTTLTRPQGTYKGQYISVCSHDQSGWLAVTDRNGQTLDIYDAGYHHQVTISLPYRTRDYNVVTSAADVVIIALEKHLSVYSWEGKFLVTVSKADLGVREDKIKSVCAVGDDRIILAAGPSGGVTALYTVTLQY